MARQDVPFPAQPGERSGLGSSETPMPHLAPIRVGAGGWTFEPWRGVFCPESLTQKRELEYADFKLTPSRLTAPITARRSQRVVPNGGPKRGKASS